MIEIPAGAIPKRCVAVVRRHQWTRWSKVLISPECLYQVRICRRCNKIRSRGIVTL